MPKEKLYFIAIIAPEDVAAEINVFKYDLRDNYNSKAALKTMPHITLKAPFKLPAADREDLLEWFMDIPAGVSPFKILIENFGSFDNSHNKVLFVKPVISPQLLSLQQNVIKSFAAAYPKINMSTHEHHFKPHMTIGYRDLTHENFDKAWAIYKNKEFRSSFTCHSICLLQHNGLRWEVVAEKPLL